MPSLSHRISVKRQTTAENFISLRILLCFVINSLLQHLHMSAPTPTSPINQQSTNHPKQRTNTIFQWSEFHAVIFVSSTVRIISTENISYGENTWKIFEERKKITFIRFGWVSFNVNVKPKTYTSTIEHFNRWCWMLAKCVLLTD